MNRVSLMFSNKFVVVPFCCWFCIQIFKFITDLIINKRINLKRLVGAGGMPSSHSAIVCSITALLGREYGFDSGVFALSLAFAMIVMYDAAGVRRAAGKQATILNKIMDTPGMTNEEVQEKLVEALGHTPVQVFVGALIGLAIGFIV